MLGFTSAHECPALYSVLRSREYLVPGTRYLVHTFNQTKYKKPGAFQGQFVPGTVLYRTNRYYTTVSVYTRYFTYLLARIETVLRVRSNVLLCRYIPVL